MQEKWNFSKFEHNINSYVFPFDSKLSVYAKLNNYMQYWILSYLPRKKQTKLIKATAIHCFSITSVGG